MSDTTYTKKSLFLVGPVNYVHKHGDYLYALGKAEDGSEKASIKRLGSASVAWEELFVSDTALSNGASAGVSYGDLIVFPEPGTRYLWRYNVATNALTREQMHASASASSFKNTCQISGTKLYIPIGGANQLEVYDLETLSYALKTPYATTDKRNDSALLGGVIYTTRDTSATLDAYDIAGDSASTTAAPGGTKGKSIIAYNGLIYFPRYGDYYMDIYEPGVGWSSIALSSATGVYNGGKSYIDGAVIYTNDHTETYSIQRFNTADNTATKIGFADSNNVAPSCLAGLTGRHVQTNNAFFVSMFGTGYSLSFNANGYTGTPPKILGLYFEGESLVVPGAGTLAEAGQVFAEWNTAADGSGTGYIAGGDFVMPAADTTLYAIFVPPSGYPAADDVREGTAFGPSSEYEGTLALPAVGDVRDGVGYGASGIEHEGNVVLPAEADVKAPTQYGANGTEYTGTLSGGGGPNGIFGSVWG